MSGPRPPWRIPMTRRDTTEAHRTATPLELFYDLCFVVAVAQAGSSLHHGLVEGHAGHALAAYPLVFFAVWWAWMNFTWFASAYDTDDVPYRLLVLVQIAGILVLAAGVPRALEHNDFVVGTLGYTIMRSALVVQWLRAAAGDPVGRPCALRYAVGISVCQVGWWALLGAEDGSAFSFAGFVVLGILELAVPAWGERHSGTPWHPHHIAERYGLFTLIVLGESVLAATIATQTALDTGESLGDLVAVAGGGLLIVFSMWWVYFDLPTEHVTDRLRRRADETGGLEKPPREAFLWGYGHYAVFASAAAVGAGLATAVDHAIDHAELTRTEAALAVTVPVAVFLGAVWLLHRGGKAPGFLRDVAVPVTIVLVLAATATPEPVLVTGLILAALVIVAVVVTERARSGAPGPDPTLSATAPSRPGR